MLVFQSAQQLMPQTTNSFRHLRVEPVVCKLFCCIVLLWLLSLICAHSACLCIIVHEGEHADDVFVVWQLLCRVLFREM